MDGVFLPEVYVLQSIIPQRSLDYISGYVLAVIPFHVLNHIELIPYMDLLSIITYHCTNLLVKMCQKPANKNRYFNVFLSFLSLHEQVDGHRDSFNCVYCF